jgi:hypothetical protein
MRGGRPSVHEQSHAGSECSMCTLPWHSAEQQRNTDGQRQQQNRERKINQAPARENKSSTEEKLATKGDARAGETSSRCEQSLAAASRPCAAPRCWLGRQLATRTLQMTGLRLAPPVNACSFPFLREWTRDSSRDWQRAFAKAYLTRPLRPACERSWSCLCGRESNSTKHARHAVQSSRFFHRSAS